MSTLKKLIEQHGKLTLEEAGLEVRLIEAEGTRTSVKFRMEELDSASVDFTKAKAKLRHTEELITELSKDLAEVRAALRQVKFEAEYGEDDLAIGHA